MRNHLFLVSTFFCTFCYGQKFTAHLTNDESMFFLDYQFIGSGKTVKIDQPARTDLHGIHTVMVITPGFLEEIYIVRRNKNGKPYEPEYTFLNTKTISKKDPGWNHLNVDFVKTSAAINDFKIYGLNDDQNLEQNIALSLQEGKPLKSYSIPHPTINGDLSSQDEAFFYDVKYSSFVNSTLKFQGYLDTVNLLLNSNYRNTVHLEGEVKSFNAFSKVKTKQGYTYYRMKVLWTLKNIYGEYLDTISTTTISGKYGLLNTWAPFSSQEFNMSFNSALKENLISLQQTDLFKKYSSTELIDEPDKETLFITSPVSVVRNIDDSELATVIIKNADISHGSGFAISNDGYIVTNFHVVYPFTSDSTVTVVLNNGLETTAKIIRTDRINDVVVLKTSSSFERCFRLTNSNSYTKLQNVYTLGAPKSIDLGQTLTSGIISNERLINKKDPLLQLSMALNFGNSGGPLFDETGHLHGIIVSKLVGFSTEGIGFAYPVSGIMKSMNINYK